MLAVLVRSTVVALGAVAAIGVEMTVSAQAGMGKMAHAVLAPVRIRIASLMGMSLC